ncbi:MAG: FAD-binding protein [Candidatus Accumulibacter sp.]|uniref:FAD-linked oxidase C-terminal domain-containing protein n=2 Tax=Accumulibacter sp. TaxID=2053492 RepID=UPI0025FD7DF5|nr:FAD-linked oxidase C-terminal domain-containing protein [Accumulibacter sp.]MCP5248090.1 FAD-binding protein [Accumulibacter sp.]
MSIATTAADRRLTLDRQALIRRLCEVLPAAALLAEEEEMRPYDCDGLTAYRQLPLLVALPENEAQAQAILRVCYELRVPVVARGAATGLSGGATPHRDGVLVSLAKLKRIVRVDPLSRTAVVQPGVRNLSVSEAAAPYGLYYAPDPSSQIACTIGGNVAENAGGVHCLKYGLTVHNVLRVRALTIAGEIVEFGNAALDAPGYDLLALLNGSEGLLAMITEVTVRLTPKPELAQVVIASFADVRRAGDAVASIIAAGIIPAGLEMMDKKAIHAVEPYVNAGYDMDAEAILLCESDGTPEEVAEEIGRMTAVLEKSGAAGIRVSQNESERLKFWAGRKAAFPAVGRITPDYLCMDGTIPRKRLAEMLAAINRLSEKYALRCANVFHAGDGNLHPLIMYDANQPGELERAAAFGAEILELSVSFGGTITGEHGVGLEKIDVMAEQFTLAEIDAFHRLKAAFDEHGLLNPGKGVPTLARCREYTQARAGAAVTSPSL